MSKIIKLVNGWHFTKDNSEVPTSLKGEEVTLPHTWNNIDGQDGGNDYYRGTCFYTLDLKKPEIQKDGKAILEFNGAAMSATVYLNGKKLTEHKGGYSSFRVDITNELIDDNLLVVGVDNSRNDEVYPQQADFTFYGGLYRDVNLYILPKEHFALKDNGVPSVKITPIVKDLSIRQVEVNVEAYVENSDSVTFILNGLKEEAKVSNGVASCSFLLNNAHLWNGVEDPYLYTLMSYLPNGEKCQTKFGCRKFEVDPNKGFILNGKQYPLRGVSRHQDRNGLGNALSINEQKEDMDIILDMGANTIRLAHYQHAQEFYDLCDEKGIVVWAEIPYITQHMSNGRANTLSQMEELIVQNYNHPSIAVWGLSNEITAASSVNEELLENHKALNDLAHKLDKTRLTTMANVFMLDIDSPILEIPDINSYNLYFGWYLGELEQNDEFFDKYHAKYPNRVIGFSEYGADANPKYQSSNPVKGDYTESYQCLYHEHILKMIEERPYLWATHVWNMFDFAADGRDEGGKNGENQKGLVTFDRKIKKDAYYLYKAYWSKKPFVHICGSRYVNRNEDTTEVKIYSNKDEISLYKDGNLIETKKGNRIFTFNVSIEGKHTIKAVADKLSEEITVNKVDELDTSYILDSQKEITNWFDGELKEGYWSIKDNMAKAMTDPKVGPIMKEISDKAAASRGDVAMAVKDNPALQEMMQRAMQRMSIESMLKQAGADEESVKQLNRILQNIPKEN